MILSGLCGFYASDRCSICFIRFSSLDTKKTAKTAAIRSATGAEYITPSIPKNIGRMRIRGRRKIIWRVRDINIPVPAFPMEVK